MDEDDDLGDASEAALLAALAAAPRPDAAHALAKALPELATTLDGAAHPPERTPSAGYVVDRRYRIEEKLGSGGMGVVFGAVHIATGRKVALKWMQQRSLEPGSVERDAAAQRFLREAQAAGRIRHPNVVDVYDAGTDLEAPYLVMEKLEGETLRARMAIGPMAWDETLALLLPAMDGIREAHRQGVVHRDIKPDNIFLAKTPSGTVPKVLDFGISRLHGPETRDPSLTRTGTLIGTPAYMPLEQLRGEGNIDARTDVYALGVVLYEMLSGTRPYVARNAADFAAQLTSLPPTPLSRYRPELKGAREAVVMKALARVPEARYANIEAFATALRAPPAPRSRGGWIALTLAGIVVSTGAFWLQRTVKPAPAAATLPQRAMIAPALLHEHVSAPPPPPTAASELPVAPALSAPLPITPPASAERRRRSKSPRSTVLRPQVRVEPQGPAEPLAAPAAAAMSREDFIRPAEDTDAPSPLERGRAPTTLELEREQF